MRRWFLLLAAVPLLAIVPAAAGQEDFASARPKIQQQLRSKRVDDRLATIRRLTEFHHIDAAKMLLQTQTADLSPDVREAAFQALIVAFSDADVRRLLLQNLKKFLSARDPVEAQAMLAAVLAADLKEGEAEILDLIDKTVASQQAGALTVIMLADGLGLHSQRCDYTALERLTRTQLFAQHFGVRRSVVDALMKIRRPEALALHIRLLGQIDGEIQAELAGYLTALTGQKFALDALAWAKWWEANAATFQFPPVGPILSNPLIAPIEASSSYYGMPIYAKRIVFVFDTSSSMNGERLEAAKRELVQVIGNLPESTLFTVVTFSTGVNAWQKQLVPATDKAKQGAITYVTGQAALGNTNTFGALEAAFGFNAEAIYFLTDGEPSIGKVRGPPEIVSVITTMNRARRESIHTIGIGVGPPGNLFDVFLAALALQNYGQYRRVDN